MARCFYLRSCLLCCLRLGGLFISSCFVVLQSSTLESSLTPEILPCSRPPHSSLSMQKASLTSIQSCFCRFLCFSSQLELSTTNFENGGRAMEHGICARELEDHNLIVLLLKPFRRTMVPLQQQRATMAAQRVRTAWTMGSMDGNYSSAMGVEWLNNGWNNGCHWQYNGNCCRWVTAMLEQIVRW